MLFTLFILLIVVKEGQFFSIVLLKINMHLCCCSTTARIRY